MLADRAITEFTRVDGNTRPADLVGVEADAFLVAGPHEYWVCTAADLRQLPPDRPLQESLRFVTPAAVAPSDAWFASASRMVLVRDGTIVGLIVDGPLDTQPMAAPSEPPRTIEPVGPPIGSPGPTRGFDPRRDDPQPGSAPPTPIVQPNPPTSEPPPPPRTRSFDPSPTIPAGTPLDLGTPRATGDGAPDETSDGAAPANGSSEDWYAETSFPREVRVGSTTSLTVELTTEASDGPDTSAVPFAAPAGTRVSVVVQARRGFEIEGAAEGSLVTSTQLGPIQFLLRAVTEGAGSVRVLLFIDAVAIGTIELAPAILPPTGDPDKAPIASSTVIPSLEIGRGRPDLELLVLQERVDGQDAYSIRVTATDERHQVHLKKFGPVRLETDARDYFEEIFREIEQLGMGTPDDRTVAQTKLEKVGDDLFRGLIPDDLKATLWRLRDDITRIRIDSEEPYIPWELIRLSGPDESGRIVAGKFLCEYETTRWIPGHGLHSDLTLRDFAVVVPSDSGLRSAQEEKAFLAGLANDDRSVTEVTPTFTEVLGALASGDHDVLHFSGHGAVKDDQDPNRFAIKLSDGESFTPSAVSGPSANLGLADPLVFLNACQVGQGGMSLTGIGGWAARFLDAGAAGFVGALWNVHDNPARDFSKTFYTRLLAGDTIGAAALAAREAIRPYQDATWLAYTVYAHPSAALVAKE